MSDAQDQQFPEDPKLGDLLREARLEKGLDLSDVAGLTNVRREYLEALEEGRYGALPEDVYTRNFLKLFAQAVGFDIVRAQEMYRGERRDARAFNTSEQRLEHDREIAQTVPPVSDGGRWWETPSSGPRWGALISTVLMVGAVVALALWGFNSTFFNPSPEAPGRTAEVNSAPDTDSATEDARTEVGSEQAAAELPRTVRLSVNSNPPGAEVLVDGFPLPGATPIESAPVTARPSRSIRVELEGYVPYEEEFDLTSDRHLSFFLTPITLAEAPDQAEEVQAAEPGDDVAATEEEAGQEGEVTLTITEDTWLEVYRGTSRNQGERLAFVTARAGQTLSFPLPVYIHVGNAGGVELTVEGQDRGVLGSSGEVRGLAVTN